MSSNPQQVQTIFLAAVEKPPAERSAYLDRECGDSLDLRRRVEALLRAHDEPGSFLDSPPLGLDAAIDRPITEQPGDSIGPYKLLEQVGEGGMGVVYKAEQTEPVERRVALKIIKPGMDTRKVIARFEAERQALAMMDHPNIAKVYDAGATYTGRPYFVMELVKGVSVTQYCDEKHLTPRERLELFVPICQAVQHAHQKGIIHRDIKPSNVLVAEYDDRPVPKIIDFGVAKAIEHRLTEETVFTEFGQVVGTPEYMSPEQTKLNQLDIDTRTDVYSLGVLLYELLTGETPFDRQRLRSAAFDELLRIIREEDPPRPSLKLSTSESLPSIAAHRHVEPKQLSATVHGELDWIVMKALEKDRTRRYDTASKFAEDVQHYLNDEAVAACPPSASYRLRKLARRNKAVIMTTAAIAVALLIGTGVATWQAIRATSERNRAVAAEEKAAEEAEHAEVEAQIAKAVNDFLQNDLLGMADAGLQVSADLSPDPHIELRTLLDRAAEIVEERFKDQPLVEAAIRDAIGNAYRSIGKYPKAEKQIRRALELRRKSAGPEKPDTLSSLNSLARVYWRQGRLDEAEKYVRQALEIRKRNLGDDHPDTLGSISNLALLTWSQGKYDAAEKSFQQVLETQQRTLGDRHADSVATMHNLAGVYTDQYRYDEAEALYRQVLEFERRTLGDQHPDTLSSMYALQRVLSKRKRFGEAAKLSRETLDIQRRVLGPEHPDTLLSANALADNLRRMQRFKEAEALHRQTLEVLQRTLGDEHPDTVSSMQNLGLCLTDQHIYTEAEELLRRALEISERTVGPEHPDTRKGKRDLVNCYANQSWTAATSADLAERDPQVALRAAQTAADLAPEDANAWDNLGVALYRNDRWEESVDALEKAREMRSGDDPWHQFFLAMAYWQAGQKEEALENYLDAARWMLSGGRGDEQWRFQAEAEQVLGLHPQDRTELLVEALGEQIEQEPNNKDARLARARLYAEQEAWDEAAADCAKAIELSDDSNGWDSPRKRICRELGSFPEAFSRVAQLLPDETTLWIGRGQRRALCSQWSAAVSDYGRAYQTRSFSDETVFEYAGTLLLTGDKQGYERVCAELTAQAETPHDSFADFVLARTCGIGPAEDVGPERLVAWASRRLEDDDQPWTFHVLGLAQYRAGEFKAAIESLEKSNAGNWNELAEAQTWLVLAMAHWRLENNEEARDWLQKAQRAITSATPQNRDVPVDVPTPDWIELELLRREAENLIGPRAAAAGEQESSENDELSKE